MALVTLGVTTAGAQRLMTTANHPQKNKMEKMPVKQQIKSMAPVKKEGGKDLVIYNTKKISPAKVSPRRAEGDPELVAWYNIPTGAFYWGMTPEWNVYNNYITQTPALISQTFINTSYAADEETEVNYQWTIEADSGVREMEQDENNNGMLSAWGYLNAPTLVATQGNLTSEHKMSAYDNQDKEDVPGYWFAGTEGITTLSHASYWNGFYGGFSNIDEEFTTGSTFNDKTVVGFAEIYDGCTDVVYATSLHLKGWLDENLQLLGEDDELKAEIFLINEDGTFGDEPVATAIATNENIEVLSEQYGSTTIHFPFLEEDPLFGSIESPIILPTKPFVIVFSGFENLGSQYTIPFASATEDGSYYLTEGHSYVLLDDGSFATIGYRSFPDIPQVNLHIGIEAAIPVAEKYFEDTEVVFPTTPDEGEEYVVGVTGYNEEDDEPFYDVDILTGSDYTEDTESYFDVQGPEWVVSYEINNSLLEQYNVLAYYFYAEPLPEDVKGRKGTVTISIYGKKVEIPVKQGEVEETIKGDVNNDGKVDVSDYIGVANHILGIAQDIFNEEAADVDGSGAIDVSDYIGVANIILTGSIYGDK